MAVTTIKMPDNSIEVDSSNISVTSSTSGTTFTVAKCYVAGSIAIINGTIEQNTSSDSWLTGSYIYQSDINITIDGKKVIGCTGAGTNARIIALAAYYIGDDMPGGTIRIRQFSKLNTASSNVYISLFCMLE